MLNEELKTPVGRLIDDSMRAPKCKDAERNEIAAKTLEFLRKSGKITELPPSDERAESLRF